MSIPLYWMMCSHSKWSGQHPGGSSYTPEPFLGNWLFSKNFLNSLFGGKAFLGGQKTITEDNHDWVMIGSPCLSVGDKITCFHPLEHFLNHIQSFKAHQSTFSQTFMPLWSLNFSKCPKMTPSRTLPTPTNPQILGQRIQILKFRRKHMKADKICCHLCPNRKKSGF